MDRRLLHAPGISLASLSSRHFNRMLLVDLLYNLSPQITNCMASLVRRSLGLASGVVALVPIGTDYSGRFKRMSSEGSVERL